MRDAPRRDSCDAERRTTKGEAIRGQPESSAESVEGRLSANGNAQQTASSRTPSRVKRESRGLEGVRETARNSSTLRFAALLHHIDESMLYESFTEVPIKQSLLVELGSLDLMAASDH